jgi:hypothetical protein
LITEGNKLEEEGKRSRSRLMKIKVPKKRRGLLKEK